MKKVSERATAARCGKSIKDVQRKGEAVTVTIHGKPAAKVMAARSEEPDVFGFMAGEFKIIGDIESPIWPHKHAQS